MSTVHRNLVSLKSKRKILGIYKVPMALQAVVASAHNGTSTGLAWFHVPVGATINARLRRLSLAFGHIATETDHATLPRIALARFAFSGTASGAALTAALRKTGDAAATASLRTAVTGLTVSGIVDAWSALTPPMLLTTSGIIAYPPVVQEFKPTDEDEFLDIAAGEGLLLYQPDAGTASDGRRFSANWEWDEYTPADTVESSIQLPDDATNDGKLSGTIAEG